MNQNKMILFTIILMDILTGMEFDLFVPSFPELQNQFALTPFWVEALLSVNFIGYCVSLFIVGDLADRYGRKPIILLGQIIFVLGSIFCLWPISWHFLLLGRFFQGIGIAAPAILSFLIIADSYSLKSQQFYMGVMNGAINIAVGISPVIGSYLTLYFHWQGNFAALLFLGLFTLAMTIVFIPSSSLPSKKESASLQGYLSVFKSKPVILLLINLLFIIIPYWIFVGMSPLLYMQSFGVSLTHFGYYQGVLALVFAFGSIFYGLLIKHFDFDQKVMLNISNYILIASLLIISWVTIRDIADPLIITLAFLPFIIGQIIPCVLLYPLSLNLLPQAKGKISALLQGTRLILTAITLQIAGYFYQGTFQSIGIIISLYILIAVMTLFLVVKNRQII